MKRLERHVLEYIPKEFDSDAIGGRSIRSLGLDARVFDARPAVHALPESGSLRRLLDSLEKQAQDDGRLPLGDPLIRNWILTYDIYSPRLGLFVEVDEHQHFSRPRLKRILEQRSSSSRPLYPSFFWNVVLDRISARPARDLDPPYRDEARSYRDELRERLPVLYGFGATVRLDEYSLREAGMNPVDLVLEALGGNIKWAR